VDFTFSVSSLVPLTSFSVNTLEELQPYDYRSHQLS
jgi:hypothetical protein